MTSILSAWSSLCGCQAIVIEIQTFDLCIMCCRFLECRAAISDNILHESLIPYPILYEQLLHLISGNLFRATKVADLVNQYAMTIMASDPPTLANFVMN